MKLLGLLGYPLSHSFSPVMINHIARQKDWDCAYFAYSIAPENLNDYIKAVKLLPISGFNVTIPYKQTIVQYCDTLSSEVQEIGAANTIINNSGQLTAYNSDVFGFQYGIENLLPGSTRLTGALIIGAGGAARAAVYVLTKMGCPAFYLVTANPEREKQWCDWSDNLLHGIKLNFIAPKSSKLSAVLNETNLIIQATPVGTHPDTESCVEFPFEMLTRDHYVYDLVYNPIRTKFVRLARQAGARAHNGLDMLAAQAVKSLEYWGYSVNTDVLYKILKEQINRKK